MDDLTPMARYMARAEWSGHSITVDLDSLSDVNRDKALDAMRAWEAVADVDFKVVSYGADIKVTDNAGASRTQSLIEPLTNTMLHADMNVSNGERQTYMHEFGHALGLQHPGPYNASADYPQDAKFPAVDSWHFTVMSYFSQDENPTDDNASLATLISPMAADIEAIQNLYGKSDETAGKTTWNVKLPDKSETVFDVGGHDTFVFKTADPVALDMRAGHASDTDGEQANLVIAPGTHIENATGGTGDDSLYGNSDDNRLNGGAGDDTIHGRGGADMLIGGAGADTFYASADDTVRDFNPAEGDTLILV